MIPATKYRDPIFTRADAIYEVQEAIRKAVEALGIKGNPLLHCTITNASYVAPGIDYDYNYWQQLGRISARIYYSPTSLTTEDDWQEIAQYVKTKVFRRGVRPWKSEYESVKLAFHKTQYPINRKSTRLTYTKKGGPDE